MQMNTRFIALAGAMGLIAACQSTSDQYQSNDSPEVLAETGAELYPVKVALGGHPGIGLVAITYVAFAVDARVQLSDGTWCIDRTQKDAKFKAGTYEGVFANCPGYTYLVEVHKPAIAALMPVQLNLANAPLDFTMNVTTPKGVEYKDVARAY